jgi:PAS domain S-box-containing protein
MQHPKPDPLSPRAELFPLLFDKAAFAVVLSRLPDGVMVYVNEAWVQMSGYSRQELIGKTTLELNINPDMAGRARIVAALNEHGSARDQELGLRMKSGELRILSVNVDLVDIEGERYILNTTQDITERKQAEQRILQLNRLYATLSQINQTIVRVKRPPELYQAVCDVTVQYGKFSLAWIGLLDEKTADLLPVACAGCEQGQLPFQEINLRLAPCRDCLVATALSAGRVVTEQDVRTDPGMLHCHALALKYGYHSQAAVPFRLRDKSVGVLNLYSTELSFFEAPEEVSLLNEIGLDISFALDLMQTEQDRLWAESRIRTQLQHLHSLHTIDQAITSSLDLRLTLNVFMDQVISQLDVDAAAILLLNEKTLALEFAAGRGFRSPAIQNTRLRLGEGLAGRAAFERQVVHLPDLVEAGGDPARVQLLQDESFVSYCGMPLVAKGRVKGVLEIFQRTPLDRDPDWTDFLITLAGQAAIAIDDAQMFDGLQRSNTELVLAYDATIEGWSRAMDLRDKETEGHTQRVSEKTIQLARAAGLRDEQIAHIWRGALLHDIGKLGVPDSILHKPGPLTEAEWTTMRMHPQYAHDMLSSIQYLRPALDIPYCHHEKWDGTGYPRGLQGELIPLAARLFAVVDVWDALLSDRPYRPGWPLEKVLEYLRAQAGSHFDPKAVDLFFQVLDA